MFQIFSSFSVLILFLFSLVDGGWSDWTRWTSCSKSCGTGFRERSRSCTQPAPKFGGKTCPGAAHESHGCNTHSCPGKRMEYLMSLGGFQEHMVQV